MIGQTISHYRILEKIGEGGMGVVYKAMDTKLDRAVALKFLAPHLLGQEESRMRFHREAKAAASLDHINICVVHEIDEADGRTFLVMPFLDGKPLSSRIAQGPMRIDEALSVGTQLAEGLEAAHAKGIVHRDIKPDNLMLLEGSRGVLKIMDFGLAHLSGTTKLTREGTTLGTVDYMSPEQITGKGIDTRTDIWSMGIVLQEMLTGRPPFHRESNQAVLYSIVHEAPEPLAALRTGVPKDLERIVSKCLAKKPDQRYQHAGEVSADLQALRGGMDQPTRVVATVPSRKTSPYLIAGVAAVVIAVLGIGWWLGSRSGPTQKAAPRYKLTQLTRDSGYTSQPAMSPSGQLIAYVSDRAGGNFDIWVQQTAGGNPIRLTDHAGSESYPAFSPDNTQVAYVANREEGGLFVVPALGGNARRIVSGNTSYPRFSPDGKWISYWNSTVENGNMMFDKVFIVPAAGGMPRQVLGVANMRHAIWAPDGKHLLVAGGQKPYGFGLLAELDWWVVPVDGGTAVSLGLADVLKKTGIVVERGSLIIPQEWLPDGNRILFHGGLTPSARNIWSIGIDTDGWRLVGEPQQLTTGTGEDWPSASLGGRIAFSTGSVDYDIHSVPLSANQGKVLGPVEKLVTGMSRDTYPSVSADGTKLLYISNRTGNADVWLRDTKSGQDRALTASSETESRGLISPDGTRMAFTRNENRKMILYVSDVTGGSERKLKEGIGNISDWLPGGKTLLYYTSAPLRWMALDVASGEATEIQLRHAKYPVHDLRWSPDREWVAFKLLQDSRRHGPLYIARADGYRIAAEPEWIPIGDPFLNGRNWWSPDGNLLYFLSQRDGSWCVWWQRLHPTSKKPMGEPKALIHLHGPVGSTDLNTFGFGMTSDRLYFPVGETRGNIWLAEPI